MAARRNVGCVGAEWQRNEVVSVTIQQRVIELEAQHGSLRAAARVLQTDVGYLSRLANGEKNHPGSRLLSRMGLRQVITYERTGATCVRHEPAV
jgi:hypothetical protein